MKRLLTAALLVFTITALLAQTVSAQTTATGVVATAFLNVRDYPDPIYGNVIARVARNEVYSITARSSFNNWWQLRLADGRLGWVNGAYLTIYNGNLAPVINPGGIPTQTGSVATVTAFHLNVRGTPDPIYGVVVAQVGRNEVYPVVGRNANASWYQIRLPSGITGWVNGRYLSVTNPQLVPQTDNTVPSTNPGTITATGTVTAFFLNVRTLPNAFAGAIIGVIGQGQTFVVVGRTADFGWWQIRLADGRTGWVSDRYFDVINFQSVPITG